MESALLPPMWVAIAMNRSLADLLEAFLNAQDIRPSSQQTYRSSLRQFLRWLTQARIHHPTREDLIAYKRFLQAKELSALTIASYLAVVRKFFAWTDEQQRYPNIATGLKNPKRPKGFRKAALTIAQAQALLAHIDRSTLQGQRDFALVNLLLRTGLRTIEVVRADIGDLRQEQGRTVLWIHGKGRDGKDEFVVLTEPALKPIRTHLAARGELKATDPLFASLSDRNVNQRLTTRSLSRIVKTHLRTIGLDGDRFSAHSLRHTAVTFALQGGATLQEAQTLARHANINTTLLYAHNLDRLASVPERHIDRLLAQAPPPGQQGRDRCMAAIRALQTWRS